MKLHAAIDQVDDFEDDGSPAYKMQRTLSLDEDRLISALNRLTKSTLFNLALIGVTNPETIRLLQFFSKAELCQLLFLRGVDVRKRRLVASAKGNKTMYAPTQVVHASTEVVQASTQVTQEPQQLHAPTEVVQASTQAAQEPQQLVQASTHVVQAPTQVVQAPQQLVDASTQVVQALLQLATLPSGVTVEVPQDVELPSDASLCGESIGLHLGTLRACESMMLREFLWYYSNTLFYSQSHTVIPRPFDTLAAQGNVFAWYKTAYQSVVDSINEE